MTITNSSFLRWRFVFVAKKFGIIEKEADHRFMNFQRLFDMHKDTPAYREAVNKVLWEDLDIPNAERCVSMIHSGEIQMVQGTVSAIGLEGIVRSKELMQPVRADHSILMAMKKRLEDEVLFASCLFCRSQWRFRCGDAPRRFKCPHCGGVMVAVLKGYERDVIKIRRDDELSAQERNDLQRLSRNANLVNEYGSRAVLVLAARGVGPDTASRILRSMYADEDDFLRAIMNAEILYAKNKRFWDRSACWHIHPTDGSAYNLGEMYHPISKILLILFIRRNPNPTQNIWRNIPEFEIRNSGHRPDGCSGLRRRPPRGGRQRGRWGRPPYRPSPDRRRRYGGV
jgi:ATP-dependent Lhr-like helicase